MDLEEKGGESQETSIRSVLSMLSSYTANEERRVFQMTQNTLAENAEQSSEQAHRIAYSRMPEWDTAYLGCPLLMEERS